MSGARETRPCATCGRALTRLVSQAKGRNWYCDKQCQFAHMSPPGTWGQESNPYRGQTETRPCAHCGQPVTRHLSPRTLAQTWACSKACAATVRNRQLIDSGTWKAPRKKRRGDTIPCEVCGTPMYRQPAYIKQGRHLCSRACNAIYQRKPSVVKACDHCGTELVLKPSQAARRFCSRACETARRT